MHLYAFGSVCRGDISFDSDIDLLAIVEGYNPRINSNIFSIYSYNRIEDLWHEGNPFAWHLSLESRLLFSYDRLDYLATLGTPQPYRNCVQDCEKFLSLFLEAYSSLISNDRSRVFDLSTVFLSIRNIATCFSLGTTHHPNFSRNSAFCLEADSIPLPVEIYQVLERSRILCTRGYGKNITDDEVNAAIQKLGEVHRWMDKLLIKAQNHERV